MQLANWSEQLLRVQQSQGSERFYPALCQLLGQLQHADECVVLLFRPAQPPQLLYQRAPLPGDNFGRYLKSAYVLDPFYRLGLRGSHKGVWRLSDIAPENYAEFEQYYNSYFRHLKIQDEVGFIIPLGLHQGFVHIELAQIAGSELFRLEVIAQWQALFCLVEQLVLQHQQLFHADEPRSYATGYLVDDFQRCFGSEVCTTRERDVLNLMLEGHCVKAIARQLKLGLETVKMHRKNLYAKLGISSHPELLALFIELLANSEAPVLRDPLLPVAAAVELKRTG